MNILTDELKEKIKERVTGKFLREEYGAAIESIPGIVEELRGNIPDNRRGSFGIVHVVKVLGEHLYEELVKADASVFKVAGALFAGSGEHRGRGVALGLLAEYGMEDIENYRQVLPFFETAAASENWDVREFTQMFFRRFIKAYPGEAKEFLLRLAESEDAKVRRFVGETLRPVVENKWFYKDPDYPLSIIGKMFREPAAYPRASVGNNLSDLARRLPDLVYGLVGELAASGDKNSYWIACRACRNLVKKEPLKVMDLLKTDEYKYKKAVYKRSDYQGNRS
jgi:3-methyladenine DNA glycosylase AlkC